MSEYVYSTDEHGGHWLTGEEIVRCRDCANLNIVGKCPCGFWALENLNGFCAWGERANFATCKCGEDIELGNRESAVCPSCGRMVIA